MNKNTYDCWNHSWQGHTEVLEEKNQSTTNPTCTAPGPKQGLCSRKPETTWYVAQP